MSEKVETEPVVLWYPRPGGGDSIPVVSADAYRRLRAALEEAKRELKFAVKDRDQYFEHCGHLTKRAEAAEASLREARNAALEEAARVCDTSKIVTGCGVSGAFMSGFEQARKLVAENIRALKEQK